MKDKLSKELMNLHVKEVFKKNKNLKLRALSEREKEEIKEVIQQLQERVDEFVKETEKKANNEEK